MFVEQRQPPDDQAQHRGVDESGDALDEALCLHLRSLAPDRYPSRQASFAPPQEWRTVVTGLSCFRCAASAVRFSIIRVDPSASENLEQIGSKEKFWFTHDTLGRCVFKAARTGTGEDWAEVVAAEAAALLGLPHARYFLAKSGGRRGVVTPSFLGEDEQLVHGNEVLAGRFASYDPDAPHYQQKQHTLGKVVEAVSESALPERGPELPERVTEAPDLFVGYLMLDVWIGNTDRHDLNWGFVQRVAPGAADGDLTYLAPTFDHASSLGRELTPQKKERRLATNDPGSKRTPSARALPCTATPKTTAP